MPEHLQTDTSPSLTSLVSGIVNDAQQLIRQELALARSEVKEEWNKTKAAAASFCAAAALGTMSLVLLSLTLVHLLHRLANETAERFPLWACYGIIGGLFGFVALILFYAGKNKAEQINMVPRQTAETMKENVQWLKNQT
jgi:hypothetical protein